jgi:hypothetical protein
MTVPGAGPRATALHLRRCNAGNLPTWRRAPWVCQKKRRYHQFSTLVTTVDLTPLQGGPFSLDVPGVETPG